MSPMAAPPERGFGEFQRNVPYDSSPLYAHGQQVFAATEVSPVFDVGRYAYLGGNDDLSAGACNVAVAWFPDTSGGAAIGFREFILSNDIFEAAQYRLPNLGPFCQVSWTPLAAPSFEHAVTLIGTNRSHPCELIPTQTLVIDAQTVGIAANGEVPVYPTDYFSGPVAVHAVQGQAGRVVFEYLNQAGVWDVFYDVQLAGAVPLNDVVVTPPGAWRADVFNPNATPTTFSLTAIPSLTGAA